MKILFFMGNCFWYAADTAHVHRFIGNCFRETADTAHVHNIHRETLVLPCETKNAYALSAPACRFRIHLVTQSAAFYRFSVGLRMFPDWILYTCLSVASKQTGKQFWWGGIGAERKSCFTHDIQPYSIAPTSWIYRSIRAFAFYFRNAIKPSYSDQLNLPK